MLRAPPLNVLWVIDHFCYDGTLHGGGRVYWNVVPQFDRDRFNIIPCVLRATASIRKIFSDGPTPLRILDKGRFDPTTLSKLLRLMYSEDVQLLHLHCYGAATFGRLASALTAVPSIIHDYDTGIHFGYPWYLGFADQLLAPTTRAAIAASSNVRAFMTTRRRIAANDISVIRHAVPLDAFTSVSAERVEAAKRNLGVQESRGIVCTVTKLHADRGIECLIEAAAKMAAHMRGIAFLIVWKHHHPRTDAARPRMRVEESHRLARLRTLAQDLDVAANVKFVEMPADLRAIVAASDIVMMPFVSDRFSSVDMIEAMALGKPVVATAVGDALEIVKDGRNGCLVMPHDTDGMAVAMLRLLGDPRTREALGGEARMTAQEHSAYAYAQRLQSLYTEVYARARKRDHSRANS